MTEEPKCRDCKWLTGKKNIRGIECMHPKNQEKWNKAKTLWMGELRKDSARYKQGSALACKKFEAKESEHMGRYIDVSNLDIPSDENDYDELVAFADKVAEMITDAPSIDIVRCKECKWYRIGEYSGIYDCHRGLWDVTGNSFCSYGEREGDR